jgi:hypothetical protein
MDLGVPLPLPVDILPDHDVDDWLLEVCREDSVDSAPVHIVQLSKDGSWFRHDARLLDRWVQSGLFCRRALLNMKHA